MITPKQSRDYAIDGGMHCPHCGSRAMDRLGEIGSDGEVAFSRKKCYLCHKEWMETWELKSIQDEENI